jgi:diguanylate cyclase (GGDEF)-like protein/PAS domain S-box-containing protein
MTASALSITATIATTMHPAWPWVLLALVLLIGVIGFTNQTYLSRWWRKVRGSSRGDMAALTPDDQLKLMMWASGELFWDYDLERRRLRCMRADESGTRSTDIALRDRESDMPTVHPQDLPQMMQVLHDHLRDESRLFASEIRMDLSSNGTWTWVRVRGRVIERDSEGRPLRIAGAARDITTRRNTEYEYRIASEVMRSMSEAVAVLDRDYNFIAVNQSFSRITGYPNEEVVGKPMSLLNSSQHDQAFFQNMRECLARDGNWSGEIWKVRKDGKDILCRMETTMIPRANGRRRLYVLVISDITEQKRAEQELRYLANYDTLTNLPNRTLLSERLSRAVVRARRENGCIAVLFIDLDRFKDINDSLGHAIGDRILQAAAMRVQQAVGAQHTVSRLGGDEFAVVLEDLDTSQEAELAAQRIIAAFEEPLVFGDRLELTVSPSIGVSLYPDHAQVPTDLLKCADTAMYRAKAIGRHTYQMYSDSMDKNIRERAILTAGLRHALERNELSLVYQPRLAIASQRIVGAEALMRWHSHEFGDISPAMFIQLAEEAGLILELGIWAMRRACQDLRRWHDAGMSELVMSVNVSALQLQRGNLPELTAEILAETGLEARFLELELTESVVMTNPKQSADTLRACRELGISLAVDDFGTGYSSLAYLKWLPINTLKIDREFISDLTRDDDDDAITRAIITMGHSLSKIVVAEGVETADQLAFLRHHQCDQAQGHYICRALTADECLQFIQDYYPQSATAPVTAAAAA